MALVAAQLRERIPTLRIAPDRAPDALVLTVEVHALRGTDSAFDLPDAPEPPEAGDDSIDEGVFDLGFGRQFLTGRPLEASELQLRLARQDQLLRAKAVPDGIHRRSRLPLRGLRASRRLKLAHGCSLGWKLAARNASEMQ